MVEGLRESARAVMARLDGAAQSTPAPASAQGGYLPAKQADDPPEGFSLETYVPEQPLYSPVQGTLTSGYGYRDNPVNGQEDFHAGLDIAVAEGTPVHCALAGQVVQAGFNRIRGSYIMVRHANGVQTLYQHLSCGFVRAGESVEQGQVIASAGSTGMSTGAHLHFELVYNGVRYDPSAALSYS
ncbi:MAG: M23 family metallopeptidase [Ruthenibacterium sp.]